MAEQTAEPKPVTFETFDKYGENLRELAVHVAGEGDVTTLSAGVVRDLGAPGRRLGVHVRDNLSHKLAGVGLGHIPADFPDRQDHPLRLYVLGSPIAMAIEAANRPGPDHDRYLRDRIAGNEADVLRQVRELVCE